MEVAETQVTSGVTETTPPPNVSDQVPQETSESQPDTVKQSGKPDGFDPVDFKTATPEQIEARIGRLYGNMKGYENESRQLKTDNQRLLAMVAELSAGQQKIVNHIQTADFSTAESKLSSDRDAAWAKGDVRAWNDANDKLNEIKINKRLSDLENSRIAAQQNHQQPRNINGHQVVNGALDRGTINNTDAAVVNSWMAETDGNGLPRRSWINASDPRNFEASKVAEAVLNSPIYQDRPMSEKLKEIDRRMGVQTQQQSAGQNVLPSGNLTRGKSQSNMVLDSKVETMAIRLKAAGNDPKFTAQDHINAYKKIIERSQAKGSKR